jgi:D-glycero-D-manno-heptose 1,7-bisphosphate phosphatase
MKVIFLDRDGVINKDIGYLYKISEFEFIDGIFEACKYFNKIGYKIIIITNQSGIHRGYFSLNEFEALTSWVLDQFKKMDINILDIFFCPHGPNSSCYCRKPKPGMIFEANSKYNIDLKSSWMIGDKEEDIETANNAGVNNTILIKSAYTSDEKTSKASYILKSINECNKYIL